MQINYWRWRRSVRLKFPPNFVWVKPTSKLETDGKAMTVKIPTEEEIIQDEIEEAYWEQWPDEDQYLGYLLDQAEVLDKRNQSKRKKNENNGRRKPKDKKLPENLKDEINQFLLKYATMKSDAVTTTDKEELKEFVDNTRNKLYHKVKKYRGMSAEVATLIKILNEKPSI